MRRLECLILLLVLPFLSASAAGKRPMTVDDLVAWERVTEKIISDDGKWIAVKTAPWEGDPRVTLYNAAGDSVHAFRPAGKMAFSGSSDYFLVSLTTPKTVSDSLKLRKVKRENMSMDRLALFSASGTLETIDSVRSYKISPVSDWIAYQRGGKKDSTLYVRTMDGKREQSFPYVTDFGFAEEGHFMYYLSTPHRDSVGSGLYLFEMDKGEVRPVMERKGVYRQVATDKSGERIAFLYCEAKDTSANAWSLYLGGRDSEVRKVADRETTGIPEGWIISPEGKISFSDGGSKVFFGTAPEPRAKDTTVLASNRPNVHVWTWNEPTLYTQQDYNRKNDLKRTYTAVYNEESGWVVQLSSPDMPRLVLTPGRDGDIALGVNTRPYEIDEMWRGRERSDLYLVNVNTGAAKMIKEGIYARPQLSPEGKYAFWYSVADSSWYSFSTDRQREVRLTDPGWFSAWDEDNDVPDFPPAHGVAGWSEADGDIYIYDRYDIWKINPEGSRGPVNITVDGRRDRIRYRVEKLDTKERAFVQRDKQFLTGFNETTKGTGFYSATMDKPNRPVELFAGDFLLKAPVKAKDGARIIFTRETFQDYPDVYFMDAGRTPVRITDGGRQKEPFIWGTAELVQWTSLDGKPLEGVVYKPADFDPDKKYPMVVNFYERNSDGLYSFRTPEPHRSTIDYRLYNSNGYVVFNPDVVYDDGYPGESCYNCVMPGISMLMEKGYVDEKAIAAQGHSWGGYQVAYLATRTRLFAAIESGAPVVNMLSAYGGIRWGTGKNRAFQYEHQQSRIGASIWERPLRYFENSPLLAMDKVETPILIMHNDNDDHVPWYQGIEYFLALRRLGKPAWMLNYTGEIHWPASIPNRVDFQKRMFQFFNHYLKGEPMPKWMEDGVPAVDRDFELGY